MAASVLRHCKHCGTANRIPANHLADQGKCGQCKQALPPVDEPVDVDTEVFDAVIQGSKTPVLVDFWADWCGPCKMAAPELKAVAHDMAGKAVVLKVDTMSHPELADRYNVRGIPNFVVLKNGRVVQQHAGLTSRSEMKRWLEAA